MTEQLRQQLTILINAFIQQNNAVETCVDKIIELLQANGHVPPKANEPHRRRGSIFDQSLPLSTASQRSRSKTYDGHSHVNNTNTVLYNNRGID
jgi:hypothetical protein